MNDKYLVRMSGISKSYPGVQALDHVDFDLYPGEIHCLVGENGAGKSTLMRILSGAEGPDHGTIAIAGKKHDALNPILGHELGIATIYQETDLVMPMSVALNIFLGHESAFLGTLVNRRSLNRKAQALMNEFGLDIRPQTPVRLLSPANQQLVQIVKALSRDSQVLILDEPSAKLALNEIEHLFTLLSRFRENGLGIIYISHHLNEVLEIGDRVTVLRDGKLVSTQSTENITEDHLIELMVGRTLGEQFGKVESVRDEVVMSVQNLTIKGQFEGISFDLHKGEVLGIAGLVGAGRTELLQCLFGASRPSHGYILMGGKRIRMLSPADAVRHGIGLVPEERRASGLVLDRSVAHNVSFPILSRISRLMFINFRRMAAIAQDYVNRLNIRTPSLGQRVRTLSGGNQQKVVLAKWLAVGVKVLLLDEPTRGIDVGAKSEIYHLINQLTNDGVSIIMVSSELPEVLGMSDRVLVMAEGRVTKELITSDTNQVEIMKHAVVDSSLKKQLATSTSQQGA